VRPRRPLLALSSLHSLTRVSHPLAAVANYYLTFSIIITIVGDSLVHPNDIAGGDPDTIKCWAGSFLEDDGGDKFDWLALVK